jgi:hypothetical protein
MECTLQIDERLLAEAREAAGTADVHRLVEMGLRELVRQRRLSSLVDSFGTVDLALSGEELHRLRRADLTRLALHEHEPQ